MAQKEDIIKKIINEYNYGIKKTNECLSAELLWNLIEGDLEKRKKKKILKHVYSCPYCLDIYTEAKRYINFAEEEKDFIENKIVRRISDIPHSMVEISLSFIQEKANIIINEIKQISEDIIQNLNFETIPNLLYNGEDRKYEGELHIFNFGAVKISLYYKNNDLILVMNKIGDSDVQRKLDDYKIIVTVEGKEPIMVNPKAGIAKFENLTENDFKIIIE